MTPEEREALAKQFEADGEPLVIVNDWDRGYEQAMAHAASIVRAHPVTSPWIPVGERLPEDGVPVLCCWAETGEIDKGQIEGKGWWIDFQGYYGIDDVTHWCPFPAPPEPR
jgi:hypothetical protein